MDRETLRSQARSRRSDAELETTPSQAQWICGFCSRAFQHETRFMEHRCREKDRHYELRSALGLAAYAHYSEWMRQKRHTVPPIETFANARLYSTFLKFAEYCTRTHIPNVRHFIATMVKADVPPVLWARDQSYSLYIEQYDTAISPDEQVLESLQLVKELAADLECAPADVFGELPLERLLKLIRERKLSGWFLFASNAFKRFLSTLSPEAKGAVQHALSAGAMLERVLKSPEHLKFFKLALLEEGL